MTYRYVPHTADVGVAFEAASLAELFEDAVRVVRELAVGDSPVEPHEPRTLDMEASDAEELLFNLLRELFYWYATDRFVPARAAWERATPTGLRGRIFGERFDPTRHEQQPEVKAVTRHALDVREQNGRWHAAVVLDL